MSMRCRGIALAIASRFATTAHFDLRSRTGLGRSAMITYAASGWSFSSFLVFTLLFHFFSFPITKITKQCGGGATGWLGFDFWAWDKMTAYTRSVRFCRYGRMGAACYLLLLLHAG